jgi:hypothetical protein
MSKCAICITEINLDDEGGHIYPDGAVVCATCDGKTLKEILKENA